MQLTELRDSSTIIASCRVGRGAASHTGGVEDNTVFVKNWWEQSDAHGRARSPVPTKDPVQPHKPVDNSNLAETNRDRPTISSNTTLEVSTGSSRRYSSTETASDNTEVQKVVCNIARVLRPEIGCKVTVATEVDIADA